VKNPSPLDIRPLLHEKRTNNTLEAQRNATLDPNYFQHKQFVINVGISAWQE